jgi:quinol monooxygenase YgiN
MTVLVAHVKLKAAEVQSFIDQANAMLAPSRAEPACITYDFYTKPDDPTNLVFVEEWESRQGLENHFQTQHFLNFRMMTTNMTDSVIIKIYEVTSIEQL